MQQITDATEFLHESEIINQGRLNLIQFSGTGIEISGIQIP